MMDIKSLYERCLNARYIHTAEGGDYSIEVEGNILLLLFEWSDGREDWLHNFDFPARPYKRMSEAWLCHRGFAAVWKAMRDEVEEKVYLMLREHPEITDIICVGYSHGAALSLFATEDMEYLHGSLHTVRGYGFGAPRVLWGIIPKKVKERLERYTVIRNSPDIVTHVPPKLLGFRDVGKVVTIKRRGKYSLTGAHYQRAYLNEIDI